MTSPPARASRHSACTDLAVPLDRSGSVPGTIALSVERKRRGRPAELDARCVALAGGPGQPALPFAEFTAEAMAAALHTRDLLVFDQRGTGASDPLSCPALERFGASSSVSRVFAALRASRSGPREAPSRPRNRSHDIEALRQAAGYEKLVLYGTCYGTKVALEYAERYPQHVEALVLDSVVPTDGPEPFAIPTFEAIAPVLQELCSERRLLGDHAPIRWPTSRRLIARSVRRPLSGSVYDGLGRRHAARASTSRGCSASCRPAT